MMALDWLEVESLLEQHDGARDYVAGALDAALLRSCLAICDREANRIRWREHRYRRLRNAALRKEGAA